MLYPLFFGKNMRQSFKEYLKEVAVTKFTAPDNQLSFEDFHKILTVQCSKAYDAFIRDIKIYRGWRRKVLAGVYDSSTGERKSQNTSNYYTKFFDTNPKNSAWPKRSKSFICAAGNEEHARSFASADFTVVFPFNGVDIAVCPGMDLWNNDLEVVLGDEHFFISINQCNEYIAKLENYFGISMDDYKVFVQVLNKLTMKEFIKLFEGLNRSEFGGMASYFNDDSNENRQDEFEDFKKQWINFYTFEDYEHGNFQLVTTIADAYLEDEGNEVWFSGKCLICNEEYLEDYGMWVYDMENPEDE